MLHWENGHLHVGYSNGWKPRFMVQLTWFNHKNDIPMIWCSGFKATMQILVLQSACRVRLARTEGNRYVWLIDRYPKKNISSNRIKCRILFQIYRETYITMKLCAWSEVFAKTCVWIQNVWDIIFQHRLKRNQSIAGARIYFYTYTRWCCIWGGANAKVYRQSMFLLYEKRIQLL